jgi:hypothetical protein
MLVACLCILLQLHNRQKKDFVSDFVCNGPNDKIMGSEQKRNIKSPPPTATSKRLCEQSDDDSEVRLSLVCLICSGLVVDAVQTPCCGRLHCRSCITKWLRFPTSRSCCSHCRAKIEAVDLIRDVRCERLSAAKLRECPHAEHGCTILANRAAMIEHELVCDFVPRCVLRQQRDAAIRERELVVAKMEQKHQATNRSLRLQLQQLLTSSLGPNPAVDSIKAMFGFTSVVAISRSALTNRSCSCMDSAWVRARLSAVNL